MAAHNEGIDPDSEKRRTFDAPLPAADHRSIVFRDSTGRIDAFRISPDQVCFTRVQVAADGTMFAALNHRTHYGGSLNFGGP